MAKARVPKEQGGHHFLSPQWWHHQIEETQDTEQWVLLSRSCGWKELFSMEQDKARLCPAPSTPACVQPATQLA